MAPDSGLARAIGILAILIVLGVFLLGVLLGRILARRLGWSGARRSLAGLGLGAIAGGGCALFMIGNVYYRDTWAPRLQVMFNAPPGFTQDWVVLLEDRRSGSIQLVLEGVEIPFFGKKTVIDVPPSGIVRVRDLSGLSSSRGVKVLWSDGSCSNGWAAGPAPKSTGATSYRVFNRADADCKTHPPLPDGAALGAYIAARERGVQ